MDNARTLTQINVHFISLVKRPATGKGLVLKSAAHGTPRTFIIQKTDDERMVAYGIVYAPDEVDLQGDMASADEIRKAAYRFMHEGRTDNIDVEHSFDEAQAYVAESWLLRKGDTLFPDEKEGAWAVGIQVMDVDVWKALKAGELTGLSLAGAASTATEARRYTEKNNESIPHWFSQWWATLKKNNDHTKGERMDKEAITELVKSCVKTTVDDAMSALLEKSAKDSIKKSDLKNEVAKAVAKAVAKGGQESAGGETTVETFV